MPPLGLASIAACLERRGIRADHRRLLRPPGLRPAIRDYLFAERPAFLGLSCTTSSFLDGIRIAEAGPRGVARHPDRLRRSPRFRPEGGALPTLPRDGLRRGRGGGGDAGGTDHVRGREPSAIQGIIFREGREGTARFTGFRDRAIELDTLPFPAYEKLDGFPDAYRLPIFNYPRAPNTSCISSRGCPYACSYCDRSVFRRSFRYNSAEYLYEHLRYLKERFGIRHINFYDDQFTFHRKRVEASTGMMIDRPLGMTFNCAVRAEHVDPELLRRMKAAGCWMISLGIETGDERLLAQHRQHADLDISPGRSG